MVVENGFTTTGVLGDPVYHSGQVFGHCMEPVSDSPATQIMVSRAGSVFCVLGEVRRAPVPAAQTPKWSEPNKRGDSFTFDPNKAGSTITFDVRKNLDDAVVAALGVPREFLEPALPQYRSYLGQITRKRLSLEATANAAMIARDGHKSFTPQSYIDAKTPPTPKAPQRASVSAAALMTTYSDDPKTGRRHGFSG